MEGSESSSERNCQSNGVVLNNKLNGKGTSSAKTARLKIRRKSLPSLAVIRFCVECIVFNSILLPVLLLLLPLLAVFNALKFLEQIVAMFIRGSIPMSGLDALWQQSNDKNRLIITTLFFTDCVDDPDKRLADLQKVILERMVDTKDENGELLYPRCRWCIRPGYFQYFFEEVKDFSIDKHVYKWDGEIPSSKKALEDIVSKISAEPLPRGRSPWYYCCIPTNYGDKSMAVVFRMHHSLSDGVSLSRFLVHQLPDHVVPEKEARKFSSHDRYLLTIKAAFVIARCVAMLLISWADRSVLHGPDLSGVKRVAWSEPFDFKRVKDIKKATGTTVNDVLMACLSGALRRYQQKKDVHSPGDLTASIPVDVRPFHKKFAFENKFAIIFLKLPVGVNGTALEQLLEMKSRMDDVKTSGEPIGMAWAMQLSVALFPNFITKPVLNFLSDKATAVVSNLPGPQNLLTVCGRRINYMTFWPPQKSSIGMAVSIYTYGGQIQLGVQGDVAVLPKPQMIIHEFDQALKELENCTLPEQTNGIAFDGQSNEHAKEL